MDKKEALSTIQAAFNIITNLKPSPLSLAEGDKFVPAMRALYQYINNIQEVEETLPEINLDTNQEKPLEENIGY